MLAFILLLLLALLIFGGGFVIGAVKWAIIIALVVFLVGILTGHRSNWW